jgi:hypothetical protein
VSTLNQDLTRIGEGRPVVGSVARSQTGHNTGDDARRRAREEKKKIKGTKECRELSSLLPFVPFVASW